MIIFTTKCSIYVAFTLFFTHTTEHNRKTFSNTINKTSFNYVFFSESFDDGSSTALHSVFTI